MANTSSSSGGIGFAGLLTIAFIVLKLTGVITWSWLWVLSPIWISLVVIGVVLMAAFAIYQAVGSVGSRKKFRR